MDISSISSIADERLFFVLTKLFSMAGGMIGLFIIDFKLTLLVIGFIPVKLLITRHYIKKRKKYISEYMTARNDFSEWFGNIVGGIVELKLYGHLKQKEKELQEQQETIARKDIGLNMISQLTGSLDNLLVQALQVLIYMVGGIILFHQELTVGSIFAFISYSYYVTGPLFSILNIGYHLADVLPSAKRFYEFMDLEEEADNGKLLVPEKTGDIEFKDVSFSYGEDSRVLEKLSLQIEKGSKVAVVGKNGSGKSTIISLLMRFFEPDSGKIMLGGENIFSYSIESYRNVFSLVSQKVYLFNDTIRFNITLGLEISEKRLMEVISMCDLEKLIQERSMDYMVGNDGAFLSGGQRQKIALARAIIYERPVLILDEATSSADILSESYINTMLETQFHDVTVIMVTHRMNLIRDMEILYVEDNGKYAYGTYQELLKSSENFKEMAELNEKEHWMGG